MNLGNKSEKVHIWSEDVKTFMLIYISIHLECMSEVRKLKTKSVICIAKIIGCNGCHA